ncbi:MAG: hypothetical protein BWY29_00788 [Microgenomates group bacterium ADurb.Bin238]|uniref:Uncharacterized protein n=1 Tax=Candidatus Chazhemtobacterium aquaticus TaxID=2715735 RepID=A0A857N8R5_9BACT|nr:MAG: hypothetical protein BWY29_00788 [Microgenomates group bacterium ADurb.Bin238]QHO63729.1 hypothetical protein MICH65_0748 [Candidatus Chazhemtobacterium aquaticus]
MVEVLVIIALLISVGSGVLYLISRMPLTEEDFDEFDLYH